MNLLLDRTGCGLLKNVRTSPCEGGAALTSIPINAGRMVAQIPLSVSTVPKKVIGELGPTHCRNFATIDLLSEHLIAAPQFSTFCRAHYLTAPLLIMTFASTEKEQPWKSLFSERRDDPLVNSVPKAEETWFDAYEADNRVASAGSSTGLQASIKTNLGIK